MKLSQFLNLFLFTFLDSPLLSFNFSLLFSFFPYISSNLLLFLLLLHFPLLRDQDSVLVSFDDLSVYLFLKLSLLLVLTFLFFLKFFDLLNHQLPFPFLLLSLLEPFDFSGLDLFNDDFFALQSLYFFPFLDLLEFLDLFEPFDLHELIFFLFLDLEGLPISLFLLELPFSDGSGLGISHHFVHEFDVVQLFIGKFLSLVLDGCLELHFLFL